MKDGADCRMILLAPFKLQKHLFYGKSLKVLNAVVFKEFEYNKIKDSMIMIYYPRRVRVVSSKLNCN